MKHIINYYSIYNCLNNFLFFSINIPKMINKYFVLIQIEHYTHPIILTLWLYFINLCFILQVCSWRQHMLSQNFFGQLFTLNRCSKFQLHKIVFTQMLYYVHKNKQLFLCSFQKICRYISVTFLPMKMWSFKEFYPNNYLLSK